MYITTAVTTNNQVSYFERGNVTSAKRVHSPASVGRARSAKTSISVPTAT